MSQPGLRFHRERGSAYIIALLVLVVLSLLGLSLALISQTELQIGANELSAHRVFYGAESGINIALANYMVTHGDTAGDAIDNETLMDPIVETMKFELPETRLTLDSGGNVVPVTLLPGQTRFAQQVDLGPLPPIREGACELCNNTEGKWNFKSVTFAHVTNSVRGAIDGTPPDDEVWTNATPGVSLNARKQIYFMPRLVPWAPQSWQQLADNAHAQKILQEIQGNESTGASP
jgi:hypothetical protein